MPVLSATSSTSDGGRGRVSQLCARRGCPRRRGPSLQDHQTERQSHVNQTREFNDQDLRTPQTEARKQPTRREEAEVRRIEENQSDDKIRSIYETLKDEPLVRWSPATRKVLGLKKATPCK